MLSGESELWYLTFNCVNLEKLPSLGFNLYIYKMLQNVGFWWRQSFLSLAFTPVQLLPWNVGWAEMLLLRPHHFILEALSSSLSQSTSYHVIRTHSGGLWRDPYEEDPRLAKDNMNKPERKCPAPNKHEMMGDPDDSLTATSGEMQTRGTHKVASTCLITETEVINTYCFRN